MYHLKKLSFGFIIASTCLNAEQKAESFEKFSDIVSRIEKIQEICGKEPVLALFDLDNTLIKSAQVLGSEQWFNWQAAHLKDEKAKDSLVAGNFVGLVDLYQFVNSISRQEEVETGQVSQIKELQNLGIYTVGLTSRDQSNRNATEREFARLGYDFSKNSIQTKTPLPYTFNHPDPAYPRKLAYSFGVMFTEGQHKGAMLKYLLEQTEQTFCAIVFVDNTEKQVQRVLEYFPKAYGFRYSHEDSKHENFGKDGDPQLEGANKAWNKLKYVLKTEFPGVIPK